MKCVSKEDFHILFIQYFKKKYEMKMAYRKKSSYTADIKALSYDIDDA